MFACTNTFSFLGMFLIFARPSSSLCPLYFAEFSPGSSSWSLFFHLVVFLCYICARPKPTQSNRLYCFLNQFYFFQPFFFFIPFLSSHPSSRTLYVKPLYRPPRCRLSLFVPFFLHPLLQAFGSFCLEFKLPFHYLFILEEISAQGSFFPGSTVFLVVFPPSFPPKGPPVFFSCFMLLSSSATDRPFSVPSLPVLF